MCPAYRRQTLVVGKGNDQYRFVQPLDGGDREVDHDWMNDNGCIDEKKDGVKVIEKDQEISMTNAVTECVLVFDALHVSLNQEENMCRIRYFVHDAKVEVVKDGAVLLKSFCSGVASSCIRRDSSVCKEYPWNTNSNTRVALSPLDFQIGSTITMYSHRFKIVDASARTREYYDSIGCPLGRALSEEKDSSCDGADVKTKKSNNKKKITQYLTKGEYIGCHGRSLQMRDNVVLKVWGWVEKDKEHVLLLFYVADNSVEMFQFMDSKLSKTRKILARNNFVEQVAFVMRGGNGSTVNGGDESPYQPGDFIVGKNITLSGRNVLIYKASEDTCRWMIENIDGVDDERMKEVRVGDDPGKCRVSRKHVEEEYDEEVITPVPDFGLDRLQFVAKFSGSRDSKKKLTNADAERRFIIQVYCSDLSVSISEMVQHSSLSQSLKFLSRQKVYRNFNLKRDIVQPLEFYIGASVTIYSHTFEILDADRATLTCMAHHPEYFELADGRKAVDHVHCALRNHMDTSQDSGEGKSLPDLLEQLLPDFTRAQLMSACILLMARHEDTL